MGLGRLMGVGSEEKLLSVPGGGRGGNLCKMGTHL